MDTRSTQDVAARLAVVDRVLANPPLVHFVLAGDQYVPGVHASEESCCRFLAQHCEAGSRTAETGSGVSSVLFTAWGAHHRVITPDQAEADEIAAYCAKNDIPTDRLVLDVASSEVALARLDTTDEPLDIFFIDGSHGYPMPIVDWLLGARHLRRGGLLVVDDVNLPAVTLLTTFLDADPRWKRLPAVSPDRWLAYERLGEGSLVEDWYVQPFYRLSGKGLRPMGDRERQLRRLLGPLRRATLRRLRRG